VKFDPFVMGWVCVFAGFALAIWVMWTSRPLDLGGGYVSEAESWRRWQERLATKEPPRLREGTRP
jgi:hypothetical protein